MEIIVINENVIEKCHTHKENGPVNTRETGGNKRNKKVGNFVINYL